MIFCTGLNAVLDKIPFQSDVEKIVGFALGTADLLGQMAASDYVEKLPVLYAEFAEVARYDTGKSASVNMFASATDLRRKKPRRSGTNMSAPNSTATSWGCIEFLSDPYPSGGNFYIDRIQANIDRLRRQLSEQSAVHAN